MFGLGFQELVIFAIPVVLIGVGLILYMVLKGRPDTPRPSG
jgi:hypothetical protein